jgi:hypothetical protein
MLMLLLWGCSGKGTSSPPPPADAAPSADAPLSGAAAASHPDVQAGAGHVQGAVYQMDIIVGGSAPAGKATGGGREVVGNTPIIP